jgi:hypothetical protein
MGGSQHLFEGMKAAWPPSAAAVMRSQVAVFTSTNVHTQTY